MHLLLELACPLLTLENALETFLLVMVHVIVILLRSVCHDVEVLPGCHRLLHIRFSIPRSSQSIEVALLVLIRAVPALTAAEGLESTLDLLVYICLYMELLLVDARRRVGNVDLLLTQRSAPALVLELFDLHARVLMVWHQ